MKKIYLITRKDYANYDEYDGLVIIAKTSKEAKMISYLKCSESFR